MAVFGPFALLFLGMLAVAFIAKVAREAGRDPVLWGMFSVLVMVASGVLFSLAGPLLTSRGSAALLAWLLGGIVIQFLGQGVLYFVLHSLEGKASLHVDVCLPVFLVDQPGEQFEPSEVKFGKEGLEVRERSGSEPQCIAYADIRAAEPDGEVVRVQWQTGSAALDQLTFMIADEELSPKARRALGVSIVGKVKRLAKLTPPS